MFGFGYRKKVEAVVFDEIGYFVGRTNSNILRAYISRGKAHGQNEYSSAIEFVMHQLEKLESIWSEDTGKVTDKDVINKINLCCGNIIKIISQSNTDESNTITRIEKLQRKIRQ